MALLATIDLTKKYYEREKHKKKEHKITQTNKFRKKCHRPFVTSLVFMWWLATCLGKQKALPLAQKPKLQILETA